MAGPALPKMEFADQKPYRWEHSHEGAAFLQVGVRYRNQHNEDLSIPGAEGYCPSSKELLQDVCASAKLHIFLEVLIGLA